MTTAATAPKPAKAPKATKKPAPKKAAANASRAMAEVPAVERRKALVKLLRQLKAFDAASARPTSVLAEKLGYTTYDVYCLVYPKFKLVKEGYVKTCKVEDENGTCAYLTKSGKDTKIDEIG